MRHAWAFLGLMAVCDVAWAQKIAVVPLDQTDETQAAASRMAEMLASGGREVVYGEPVFEAVAQHKVPVNPTVATEFVGISERIARGGNDFFYKGESQALEVLAPVMELGVREFSYLASRPDLVPQFYEAGLIVLRAYQGLKRPEDVRATASMLARLFPALSPSLKTAPPDVLELMRTAREGVVVGDGASVGVRVEGEDGCIRYLNGTPIEQGSYPVAANSPVYVFVECSGRRSDVWELRVPPGKQVVVPITASHSDRFELSDDSFESRREAEVVMLTIAFWGGFDEVVGVRQPSTQANSPTLFGHLRERHVTWTETRDVPAFEGFVERTFDVRVQNGEVGRLESASETDWTPWVMVGTGVVMAAGGGVSIWMAEETADDIVCSGSALEKPEPGACENVGTPLTEEAFEDEVLKANVLRIGGVAAAGVGLGLVGWGIWKMVGDETSRVEPARGGFAWRF